jgi:ubiquinone/menaquinone biosynthesis C-methylase UbiE
MMVARKKSSTQYYNQTAVGYNELHSQEQLRKLAIIRGILKAKKTDLLLDVGCGTGLSKILGCRVIGIDPSLGLLRQAEIPRVLGVAEFLPFKNKIFDIVISVTAIHNFNDREKGLKEIERVGKRHCALTVLKKSKHSSEIVKLIRKNFRTGRAVEEQHDYIFVTN